MNNRVMFPKLFTPININDVEIKNRIVFLPHGTGYIDQKHAPTDREMYYYEERAKGGAGLIVLPSQAVHPTGSHPVIGIGYDRNNIPKFKGSSTPFILRALRCSSSSPTWVTKQRAPKHFDRHGHHLPYRI